jgi:hypothetical protein
VCYTPPTLKLRTYFATLVAVTLVPLLALAVAVVLPAMRDRHASVEHGLQERAVTLGVGVDRELDSSITARLEQVLTRDHSEGRRVDATEVTTGESGERL